MEGALQSLGDPRRHAGSRDRDAYETGFRDRGHGDESETRLIYAAEQKAIAVGGGAQPRRKRFVLRRGYNEERVAQILFTQPRRIVDAPDVGTCLAQCGLFLDGFAIVGGADHQADAALQV